MPYGQEAAPVGGQKVKERGNRKEEIGKRK